MRGSGLPVYEPSRGAWFCTDDECVRTMVMVEVAVRGNDDAALLLKGLFSSSFKPVRMSAKAYVQDNSSASESPHLG